VVHLDDREPARPRRLPVGEGVEPGAQHHVLRDAARRRVAQPVLGVAAARDHVRAPRQRLGRAQALGRGGEGGQRRRVDERGGDRVVEHARLGVEQLVGGAEQGHAERGAARGARGGGRVVGGGHGGVRREARGGGAAGAPGRAAGGPPGTYAAGRGARSAAPAGRRAPPDAAPAEAAPAGNRARGASYGWRPAGGSQPHAERDMARRTRVWLVVALLFLALNAAAGVLAAAWGEPVHAGVHAAMVLLGAAAALWLAGRGPVAARRAGDAAPALGERLTSLEESVDAVAVEVERIGEGQRFVTRLLTETPAPAGAGQGAADVTPRRPAAGPAPPSAPR
jgi:hypothetical protein